MSTVDKALQPCPHCQAEGTAYYIRMHERYVACARCGVRGPLSATEPDAIAAWNRLSDAAALARAVGVLGQGVDRVEFRQWIEGWGSRAWGAREEIAGPKGPRTLAAALIALAEQVTE